MNAPLGVFSYFRDFVYMSQYGGGKPPVWGSRPAGIPPGGGVFPGAAQFQMGIGSPMMGAMSAMQGAYGAAQHGGMGIMGGMSSLSQAASRHPVAPQRASADVGAAAGAAASGKNQRTFVGKVTKMHDNYGFVDSDVFFQSSVVRGPAPRVHDRVMVEASFNPNMPFKWNAYRVQVLPEGQQGGVSAPPPSKPPMRGMDNDNSFRNAPPSGGAPPRWSGPPGGDRGPSRGVERGRSPPPRRGPSPRRVSSPKPPPRRTPPRRSPPPKRAASPPRREERKRERERSPQTRHSSQAPSRRDSPSPPRRRQRIIPRYVCNVPKPLATGALTQIGLKKRYTALYVPSDFVEFEVKWPSVVSPAEGINDNFTHSVEYHVLHKDVDPVETLPDLEPADADHKFQVKVLLLSHADRVTLHQKAFGVGKDGHVDEAFEPTDFLKNISFLVGQRGKEFMGIGGSWSPSLDGTDPLAMTTMIKTAIRTTKALTGIDLSSSSSWCQLGQARYYRADKDRVDRVTLLLPTTDGLNPSDEAYAHTTGALQAQLAAKIAALEAPPAPVGAEAPKEEAGSSEDAPEAAPTTPKKEAAVPAAASETTPSQEGETPQKDADLEEDAQPTHWSKLDVKNMKVTELRHELAARQLDSRGIKMVLQQRLDESLEKEKAVEASKPAEEQGEGAVKAEVESMDTEEKTEEKKEEAKEPEAVKDENEKAKCIQEDEAAVKARLEEEKKKKEKEEQELAEKKAALKKKYALPSDAKILVFPNREFKSGKFDCRVVSLRTLLEYRHDDNKESQFEVSLYAEAFRELLERHYIHVLYDAIAKAADRDEEKKGREEAAVVKEEAGGEEKKEGEEESKEKEESKEEGKKEEKEKESKKKKETQTVELKSVVQNRNAFEAFAFFDGNMAGYLSEQDAEELLLVSGFSLSRAHVQKVLKRWARHEKISYRYITDQLIDKDGNVRFTPRQRAEAPSVTDVMSAYQTKLYDGLEQPKGEAKGAEQVSDGMVVINGLVINVQHKLEQLKKLEEERDSALLKLGQTDTTIKTLKDSRDYLEKKKKRLEDDVDRYRRRKDDAEKNYKSASEEVTTLKGYLEDLQRVRKDLNFVMEKLFPPPPPPPQPKEEEKEKKKEAASSAESKDKEKEKEKPKENGEHSPSSSKKAKETESEEKVEEEAAEEKETSVTPTVGEATEDVSMDQMELADAVGDDVKENSNA